MDQFTTADVLELLGYLFAAYWFGYISGSIMLAVKKVFENAN